MDNTRPTALLAGNRWPIVRVVLAGITTLFGRSPSTKVNLPVKWIAVAVVVGVVSAGCGNAGPLATKVPPPTAPVERTVAAVVALPEPRLTGEVPLEKALHDRRSVRDYTGASLTLGEVGQLLWAAQGITTDWGGRTAPSAGALYPLEVYLVAGDVESLAAGVYRYQPRGHQLIGVRDGDVRSESADAALGQSCVRDGAIDIVIAAVYERTARKYGDRATRYVHMEAGHAAQNVCLQATGLGLGAVTVGAFDDSRLAQGLGLAQNEVPLYIIPVGRPG
ncbi:MAG: SagB/ThcOx family dehydrogenase [Chloroflexota bacterium]